MDAWGIIMSALTMFGMLVLTIAHVTRDTESQTFGSSHEAPDADPAAELKKAA